MRVFKVSRRRLVTVALPATLLLTGLTVSVGGPTNVAALTPPVLANPGQITSEPLPTVQIDGVVWAQHILGNRVYVVGSFNNARPAGAAPGTNLIPKSNILAYDITTGVLDTQFNASLNAQGRTVTSSPDGSRLYVGGNFTSVNGVNQYRIAALDPVTGSVVPGFSAIVDYQVNALVATSDTLYAGGAFQFAGGNTPRARLAAFSAANGALRPWAPTADEEVSAMTLTPDRSKLIVGGRFGTINGSQARGTAAIDLQTGASLPWAMNNVLATYGTSAGFTDLAVDGDSVYGTAFHFGGPSVKFEGVVAADPATGAIKWINDCHGDHYAVTSMNGVVYSSSHAHYCANFGGFPQTEDWARGGARYSTAVTAEATGELRPDTWKYVSFTGDPAPSLVSWDPDWQVGSFTTAQMAGWTVESNSEYLLYGGEFTRVNNIAQQGLVRFAAKPIAPGLNGPVLGAATYVPKLVSNVAGQVRITTPANWDRDSLALEYRIIRNGDNANPIFTTTVESMDWNRPTIGFTDTGLAPGSTQSYRVRVNDADGNVAWGNNVSIAVASAGSPSAYSDLVLRDRATVHWRLGEPAGATGNALDAIGLNDGTVGSNTSIVRGGPGALVDDADTSYNFTTDATSSAVSMTGSRRPVLDTFSIEAWVRTSSNTGGRIIGFSNNASGDSGNNGDRHMYMTNNGRVMFGVFPASGRETIESSPGLNDGVWHHVVATMDAEGMKLYVDGALAASRTDVQNGRNYYGFWRVGRDTLTNWPSRPTSSTFLGSIDEPAVYEFNVLSPQQVASHYAAGIASFNQVPVAAFVPSVTDLSVEFDGSGSSDDGSVASWEWDFGDGSDPVTTTVGSVSHLYTAAGLYTVSLTVTDDQGAVSAPFTDDVTVTAPNGVPVAAFVPSVTDLSVEFDGSGSSDDGSVASWEWDFGDGSDPVTTTVGSVSHLYTAAGLYTVSLTVTDDQGAVSAPFTDDVTVTAPNGVPVAAFVPSVTDLSVEFDGSGSSDDGSVASWEWDFGDGSDPVTTTVGSVSHLYTAAGLYTVSLTVTDDQGAVSAPFTDDVTVTEPAIESTLYDFDGDGQADAAVFRDGAWFVQSSTGAATPVAFWGTAGDVLVPADYDGDGKTDIAVFRDGAWYVKSTLTGETSVAYWGIGTDVPVPADYDGDGKTDIAVFRDGAWFVQSSAGETSVAYWGTAGDVPVPADFDGDGKTDIAVFRDGAWFVLSSAGETSVAYWGTAGDVPVPADYDGDGKADIAVFRDGAWFVLSSAGETSVAYWGIGTDVPVPADYDGDGKTDIAVFRDGTWFVKSTLTGEASVTDWGIGTDIPIPAR